MWPSDESPTEVALDLLTIAGYAAIGFLIATVISVILTVLMRFIGRKRENLNFLSKNLRVPQRVFLALLGTGTGVLIATDPTIWKASPSWRPTFEHCFLIVMIFAAAYGMTGIIKAIEDAVIARNRNAQETPQFRRVRTQMQVIARVLIGVVWVGAGAGALLTFDQFRAIGTSLLASAGLISLVAGLAAQSSLTNVFAGMQIAFTDSLRVGDIVVADGNTGTIEEITLTYVVMRSWDERRWIVPSTLFTSQTFENWTRLEPKLLGTVEFDLDWLVPVEAMRIELQRIVKASDLWDGRNVGLQVTDAVGGSVRLRAVVSAETSSKLWDLRCLVREELINWLQTQTVYALPRTRLEPETTTAPPPREREDFVEQLKADWEAQQHDEADAQLKPPTEVPEHPTPEEGSHASGRLAWLRTLRRRLS